MQPRTFSSRQTLWWPQRQACLYTSQPNVSKVISSLEKELGRKLVERSSRGLRITPYGETVRDYAKVILKHASLISSMATHHNGKKFTLATYPSNMITNLLVDFYRHWGNGYIVEHQEGSVEEVSNWVASGQTEIGIVYIAQRQLAAFRHILGHKNLEFEPIDVKEAYYPMLTELGCIRPFAMISPNCMINGSTKDGVNGHIGTGPYVLTDFVTDEYAVFERNENYWGEAPAIRKITVKVIPDNQTRIMALESGEIDLIFGKNMIDADAISQYLDSDKFTVGLSDPTSTRHIVMNTTHEILGDSAVRKALQHATDRQTISDGIFYGLEQPADTLYATTVPYCNVGLKPYEYSTETAAQILDEAGWVLGSDKMRAKNGKQLALDLLYNSDSVTEKTIAEYLQSEYLKLGISMTIHGEEEQSYRDNMKAGNFDMVFNICWGMPYDPQSSLAAMRAPVYGDYAAQQGLEDKAEIDEAITKILTSTDETERQELYKSVLTNLHEDAMYLPLTYECNKALYTSALHGVHFGTDQYDVPFADMYFE